MADLGVDYAVGEERVQSFDPIPAGKYDAMITSSDVSDTRANNGGKVLKIEWTIISGDYQGRKIFDNVNLANPNVQAQEIGRKQLNTISDAVGYGVGTRITDSTMLHDKPCIIDVKIQPAGPDRNGVHREARNVVRGYERPGGAQAQQTPPKQSAPQQSRQPVGAGAGSAPRMPWQK